MVLAGVSLHHKTNIVFMNGNLTASRYQHECWIQRSFHCCKTHRGMQLLHDGAQAYHARATTEYLNANNVNVANFPSKSSD